ncbi:MAG: type III-B CRISPR module-associated protein Cmr5 [Pseudothermotoga sp.]|nr:type III-B CRISPR module-associated protein Cmr5 [Pseudothermotoga sp.]
MIDLARRAGELVMELRNSNADKRLKEEYLKAIRNFGPLVIQNGLAAAIIFAKKKWPKELLKHIDELVKLRVGVDSISEKVENFEIFQENYLWIQLETLNAVTWLKRYAEILLGGEEK